MGRGRVSSLLLVLALGCTGAVAPAPSHARATPVPAAPNCPILPSDNIWHADVTGLPVHPKSGAWISSMGGTSQELHPDFGPSGLAQPYGIPYDTVGGGHAKVTVDFTYDDESDPGPYPFDANTTIEMGSDRHALIVDRDACVLYELFDAHWNGGNPWAGSGAIFDMRSNALRPETWTSADAAGLSILAGLLRLDEVQAGFVDHAIRFTAAETDTSYVWPARHQAGERDDPNLPPMGARFRMKASFDISGFRPDTQVVLQAMKTYGLMLSDNGSDWYFQGTSEDGWDSDMLDELKSIPAGAFEAVDASSLMVDPDSGQAAGEPPPPPPPGPTVTVKDFSYAPKASTSPLGATVTWKFTGPATHTATDRSGMSLFGSGARGPGASWPFTFVASGVYPYRCIFHPTKMQGTVRVPVVLSSASGPTAAPVTVTWSSGPLPSGTVADVQVKKPGATKYITWRNGVTSWSSSFTPDAGVGDYLFRARLRRPSNGAHATYSRPATYHAA